jgi:hypothetical protein
MNFNGINFPRPQNTAGKQMNQDHGQRFPDPRHNGENYPKMLPSTMPTPMMPDQSSIFSDRGSLNTRSLRRDDQVIAENTRFLDVNVYNTNGLLRVPLPPTFDSKGSSRLTPSTADCRQQHQGNFINQQDQRFDRNSISSVNSRVKKSSKAYDHSVNMR